MTDTLLSIDDIAALCRVKRRTVADHWIHMPNFPAPKYAPTRRTRLWAAADIERWAAPAAPRSAPPLPGSSASEAT